MHRLQKPTIAALVLCGAIALAAGPLASTVAAGGVVITIDSTGAVSSGVATISGTITCSPLWTSPPVTTGPNSASLTQPVGRFKSVSGQAYPDLTIESCDSPTPFSFRIFPSTGKFAGGTAYATVTIFGCDQDFNCDGGQATAVVKLH